MVNTKLADWTFLFYFKNGFKKWINYINEWIGKMSIRAVSNAAGGSRWERYRLTNPPLINVVCKKKSKADETRQNIDVSQPSLNWFVFQHLLFTIFQLRQLNLFFVTNWQFKEYGWRFTDQLWFDRDRNRQGYFPSWNLITDLFW